MARRLSAPLWRGLCDRDPALLHDLFSLAGASDLSLSLYTHKTYGITDCIRVFTTEDCTEYSHRDTDFINHLPAVPPEYALREKK
jgi:hypothetical protein